MFGVTGTLGKLLRFILFFLLGLLLLSCLASAATITYTPVRSETTVWHFDGQWRSLKYDDLFLAGARETTVAQTLFEIPDLDMESVISITYRVSVPQTFGIQSLSYIKIYGVAGDPAPSLGPGGLVPNRTLLYSSQWSSKIAQVLEFDLTNAIRNTKLDVGSPEGFRVDFTAYLPGDGALPLVNPELVIRTVPEPTTPLLLLSSSGFLLWSRRFMRMIYS